MAGDFWEQAVETFLTIDRGLFLNPQYLVGEPEVWEANADFLAISFPDSIVWMVEVTKSPRGGLFSKIKAFENDYAPRIRHQLQQHRVVRGDDPWTEWTVGLWVFAPGTAQANLESRMRTAGIKRPLVTPLEHTVSPDWNARFR